MESSEVVHTISPLHMPEPIEDLLNIQQAARVLGMSVKGLRTWVWKRKIEFVRVGRSIKFRPETLRRYIDRHTVKVAA